MKSRHLSTSRCIALLVFIGASSGAARRTPAPGGEAVVSIPSDLVEDTVRAHQAVPIVERVLDIDRRTRVTRPPLHSHAEWRSAVLNDVVIEDESRRFRLKPDVAPILIVASIGQCVHPDEPTHTWPAHVLRATGMSMEVSVEKNDVVVVFDRPFGAFFELMAGCLVASRPMAPYVLDRRTLVAQRTAIDGPPSIVRVEIRPDAETGDLVVGGFQSGMATIIAPYADMLLVIPSSTARDEDPLGLKPPNGSIRSFHAELRPDLLAGTYWAGTGGPHFGILPAGLAPARPLPDPPATTRPLSLSLAPLAADAPRVSIHRPENDPLVDGVVERLAVLLRSRGYGMTTKALATTDGLTLVRWRPPTDDPALALLALAGQHPALFASDEARALLQDPRLTSKSLDERVAGAISLERSWLEGRRVVPLLFVQLHYALSPGLRGVRIRPDGVPLLDNAYWSDFR